MHRFEKAATCSLSSFYISTRYKTDQQAKVKGWLDMDPPFSSKWSLVITKGLKGVSFIVPIRQHQINSGPNGLMKVHPGTFVIIQLD